MLKIIRKTSFVICIWFLLLPAYAISPKAAVAKAYQDWCAAIETAKGNPEVMTQFYASRATLLPTLSPDILVNEGGGFNKYFTMFTSNPNIKCRTDKLNTLIYGNFAINNGLYTFTFTNNDGLTTTIPARFTFVYEKIGSNWMIITHHSSKLPD